MAHPEYQLSFISFFLFRYFLWRRRRGMPLAYIVGHKEFYGIDFVVNKRSLIPRPDTEVLVESVVEEIRDKKRERAKYGHRRCGVTLERENNEITLIDVGTGSGCVPIAIISALGGSAFGGKTFAIDIAKQALKVARENARIQNVSIEFLHGDLLKPVIKKLKIENSQIIITANLPYGWKEWKNESSVETVGLKFEPENALFTGENGLELIRKLLEQIRSLLLATHYSLLTLIEFDPRQTPMLTKLIVDILPNAETEIIKDLGGHDRVIKIFLKK